MKKKKQVIVLDFATGDVHIFPFDENEFDTEDIVDFFDAVNEEYDLYLKEGECQWMFSSEDKLTITTHL